MLALYKDKKTIDAMCVARQLGSSLSAVGGEAYLIQLQRTLTDLGFETTKGLPTWAKVVDDAGRLIQAKEVLTTELIKIEDVEVAIERIQNVDDFFEDLLSKIGTANSVLSTYKPIEQALDQFLETLELEANGEAISWIPIGWPSFNKYKILKRSALTVIKGVPSCGKSQLLIQFAMGMAVQLKYHNLPGVICLNTYEMPGHSYSARMASCLAGVNLNSREVKDTGSDAYDRLRNAVDFIKTLPILYDDGDMSSSDITSQTLAVAAEYGGIHMVGIDFSELIPNKGSSEELRVSSAFRHSQKLGKQLDAAIVMVSQVTGVDPDTMLVGMGGHRYTGAGWQAAEADIEVYNPIYLKQAGKAFRVPSHLSDDSAWALIQKNKNGPLGAVRLNWVPGTTTFSDPALSHYEGTNLFENLNYLYNSENTIVGDF